MLFKIQNIYLEIDEIQSISHIKKYNGNLYFVISLKNKESHDISWNIANNFDEEIILFQKMETLRKEIVKLKNKVETIIELGQSINLKKPNEIKVTPKRPARK